MDSFTDADRRRAEAMAESLAKLERQQRRILRMQRAAGPAVAKAIVEAVGRRAMLLLAAGMIMGSALGGAAMELARKLVITALAGH